MKSVDIDIWFDDLSKEKKDEIYHQFGEFGITSLNVDVAPICTLTLEVEENEEEEAGSEGLEFDIFRPGHSRGWRYRDRVGNKTRGL